MKFYCGAQQPKWLTEATVPLFYAWPAIMKRRKWPIANTSWALDSGGFSELRREGKWTFTAEQYVTGVERMMAETQSMPDFIAIMDWAVGQPALDATGKSVEYHQAYTVLSWLELTELRPDWPWAPVLQGSSVESYHKHIDLYVQEGVDLRAHHVAVGSIAARNADPAVGYLMRSLHAEGLKLHGLGVNPSTPAVKSWAHTMNTADSFAWMRSARFRFAPSLTKCEGHADGCPALDQIDAPVVPDHRCTCDKPLVPVHKVCSTCMDYACLWARGVQQAADTTIDAGEAAPSLFDLDDTFDAAVAPQHGRSGDRGGQDALKAHYHK